MLAAAAAATLVSDLGAATAQSDDGAVEKPLRGDLYEIKPVPAGLAPRLRFEVVNRKKGLPQAGVHAIAQDPTGFVWLGTEDGLARYDGQRIRVFRSDRDDPSTLSNSYINALLVSKDGTLWVGTLGGGVDRYRPATQTFDRFVASDAGDTLDEGTILAMSEGSDGRIWIGTRGGGLAALDPASGKVTSYSEENGLRTIVQAVLAEKGAVWVGTASGLYRFDTKEKRGKRMFRNEASLSGVIKTITRDSRGDLWIGTDADGLVKFSPKTKKLKVFQADEKNPAALAENKIDAVLEDRKGRIWVGTDTVLHLYDSFTGSFSRNPVDRDTPGALPGGPILTLFDDASGVIWVGTNDKGAATLDPLVQDFHYYAKEGISEAFRKGDLMWVVTATGPCRWRGKKVLDGVCYPGIGFSYSALVDRHGTSWIGTTQDGLYRLEPDSTDRWLDYAHDPQDPTSIAPGAVTKLFEDHAGTLWVGTMGGGVQSFDRERETFTQAEAIPSSQIFNIKADPKRDDVLWVGTADQGLVRYNTKSHKVKQFLPEPDDPSNLTDNAVADFLFEGDGTMWLATYGGGLKHLDRKSGKFKSYRSADGLPNDTIYAVLQDKSGRLWLSSNAGLARFDPKTKEVRVFTAADGLQSDEFVVHSGVDLGDGRFFFGGVNGFNIFDPEEIKIDRFSPPVVLTSINILNKPYRPSKPIEAVKHLDLDYDQSFVEIDFASLAYSASDRLSFEYKIEGLNDSWYPAHAASVSLPGLKDGSYTMLLRARNRHGVESKPSSLSIVVHPPPWRTWWAYALYLAVAVALVLVVLRRQQKRAKAKIEAVEKEARLAFAERELELTAAVQTGFLPDLNAITDDRFALVGYYSPAEQCSGDWWWHEKVGDNRHLMLVGDVTGHGAGPAMVTASVSTTFRVLRHVWKESGPVEFLRAANEQVLKSGRGTYMMQLMAAELDVSTGVLELHSAAGLPAVCMLEGKRKLAIAQGTPLGSPNFEVGHTAINLSPGDRFMLLTDGIPEIERANGRPLGVERVGRVFEEVAQQPLPAVVDHIVGTAQDLNNHQKQKDDWTFVLAEWSIPGMTDVRTSVRPR